MYCRVVCLQGVQYGRQCHLPAVTREHHLSKLSKQPGDSEVLERMQVSRDVVEGQGEAGGELEDLAEEDGGGDVVWRPVNERHYAGVVYS